LGQRIIAFYLNSVFYLDGDGFLDYDKFKKLEEGDALWKKN